MESKDIPTLTSYERFSRLLKQLLSVPHSEVQELIKKHRTEAARNPHRRGPKRKPRTTFASPGPDEK